MDVAAPSFSRGEQFVSHEVAVAVVGDGCGRAIFEFQVGGVIAGCAHAAFHPGAERPTYAADEASTQEAERVDLVGGLPIPDSAALVNVYLFRHAWAQHPVGECDDVHRPDGTNLAGAYDTRHGLDRWVEGTGVTGEKLYAVLVGCLDHGLGLFEVDGERLLNDDVLAGVGGHDGVWHV